MSREREREQWSVELILLLAGSRKTKCQASDRFFISLLPHYYLVRMVEAAAVRSRPLIYSKINKGSLSVVARWISKYGRTSGGLTLFMEKLLTWDVTMISKNIPG